MSETSVKSIMNTSVFTIAEQTLLSEVSASMLIHNAKYAIALNSAQQPVGIFSEPKHAEQTNQQAQNDTLTIGQVLNQNLFVLPADTPIPLAYQLFCEHQHMDLPVINEQGQLLGVVNDQCFIDYLQSSQSSFEQQVTLPFSSTGNPNRPITKGEKDFNPIDDINTSGTNLNQKIEQLKQTNILLERKNTILDLVSQQTPLKDILETIHAQIESDFPEMLCSIMLLDENGTHLHNATQNKLPKSINSNIESIQVSENQTEPALSIIQNKAIITQRYTTEEHLPNQNSQRTIAACWALPIQDYQNQAVGAFALYRFQAGPPENHEIQVLEAYAQLAALAIEQEKTHKELANYRYILEVIRYYQMRFISENKISGVFRDMLRAILELTESEFGLIAEVLYQENGTPCIRTHAITDFTWNDDLRLFYGSDTAGGIELYQQQTLFGAVINHAEKIIANDPKSDPRHGELPQGHPEIHNFLGLPLFQGNELLGMICIANRMGGYNQQLSDQLQPVVNTCANMLTGFQIEQHRKQTENWLKDSELRYQELLHSIDAAVWEIDAETFQCTFISQQAERLFGHPIINWLSEDNFWLKHIHPEDRDIAINLCNSAIEHQLGCQFEYRMQTLDGNYVWVKDSLSAIVENERVIKLRGLMIDITENKKIEQEQRIAATTFESQEGIVVTDADQIILRVNKAFTRLTGFEPDEVIGQTPDLLKSDRHSAQFYLEMELNLKNHNYWQGEIWNRHKSGAIIPEWLTITAVTDDQNQVTHYVGTFSDISKHKEDEERIQHLAFYDALTHLPNRSMFNDRVHQAVAASERHNQYAGILFIDLDNFKTVNDTMGHAVGDQLLIEVAKRLKQCVRTEDTLGRLGGDEFVVLLEDLTHDTNHAATLVETITRKILFAIKQTYHLNGHNHHSSSSIGICLFKGNKLSVDEILRRADVAMYEAKQAGKNTLMFFDPTMQKSLESHSRLISDLHQALKFNQFKLLFHPQVDHNKNIIGAEVLLRWEHPERGLVSPNQFITATEETGLIVPIGLWVLRSACLYLKSWQQSTSFKHLSLAINVSPRQFKQHDFVEQVSNVLIETGVDPAQIKLELTETLLLDNVDETIHKMQLLKQSGISFSMDDFGTGYSSLSYLKLLPLSQLKIDQSFVRDINTDPNDAAIVKTIIAMADSLGLEIIAEGVENEKQLQYLIHHGCRNFQGYLFSRPIEREQFESLFESGIHLNPTEQA